MTRDIITYPNKILFQDSIDVIHFDEKLHVLLDDMYETMIHNSGVGLAAIQIGEAINAVIINLPNEDGEQYKEDLIEAINPKIIQHDGEQYREEGCLSVPNFQAKIKRFNNITIEYYDRFGKKNIQQANEYLAVAWQHELDHLTGSLFIEKLSIIDRKNFKKYLNQSS